MKFKILRCRSLFLLWFLPAFAAGLVGFAAAQDKPQSKPIDIDKELEVKLPQSRAQSYYHYALSKWYESSNDIQMALAEMRRAVKYNESSSAAHVGLASLLLDRSGDLEGARSEAEAATRLDPNDPEAHWLLANIYFKSQGRDSATNQQLIRKAVSELETMSTVAPQDERSYFALGTAYLELGETDKGVKAFEKFQTLVPATNAGYVEIAQFFDRKNNPEKAIEFLKKAVDTNPDSTETLMMLATAQSKQGKTKESIDTLKKVLQLTPENLPVKQQLARLQVEIGEFAEASRLLDELRKASPDDKSYDVLIGRAQLGTRHFSEAIQTFKSVLQETPDSTEAQFYLGNAYAQTGDAPAAIKIFSDLVNKSASSGDENRKVFQMYLASAYSDSGDTDKAVAIYEQLYKEENPPESRLVFQLINAYRLNRQFDKALALGKAEFEKNPGGANEIGLVYARTLADTGKQKEGAEVLNRMLQSDPSNVDVYVNLSQVYLQGHKYVEAEKVLRRAEEKNLDNPDRERLKLQLASVYERSKDYDRAESLFKEMLKDNPKNAGVLNYIGYMLADRGVRLQEAVQYVRAALDVEPNNPAYLDSLGWAFYKLNDYQNAEKYLLQAVGLIKNDPTMYDHLGDLYFKTGEFQKAFDFWNKSVQIGNPTEPEETQKVREKLGKLQETLRKKRM